MIARYTTICEYTDEGYPLAKMMQSPVGGYVSFQSIEQALSLLADARDSYALSPALHARVSDFLKAAE